MPRRKSKITKTVAKTINGLVIPKNAKKCLTFDETGNELWEIENILDQRVRDGKNEYLVKWTNWPYRYSTWEPEEHFLEDMSIILEYAKEKNEGIKRMFKGIGKQDKPAKKRSIKSKAIRRSGRSRTPREPTEPESSDDTKIVIERFTTGDRQKMTDMFICRESQSTDVGDIKRNLMDSFKSHRGRSRFPKAFTDDGDSMRGVDSENLSEVSSQKDDFLGPVMDNEREELGKYKVVVEECFTYSNNIMLHQGSVKFKVAFYDDEENLKGVDYFSYEEIKQRNWDDALMQFYTHELLNEMMRKGASITSNIKII